MEENIESKSGYIQKLNYDNNFKIDFLTAAVKIDRMRMQTV
jgi:hypothetical protein